MLPAAIQEAPAFQPHSPGYCSRLTARLRAAANDCRVRLGPALLSGARDAVGATLPAKSAGLGLLLWSSGVDEDRPLVSSGFGMLAAAAGAIGAAGLMVSALRGSGEPADSRKVIAGALGAAAVGTAVVGMPAMALVGAAAFAGAGSGLLVQRACGLRDRPAAVFAGIGLMLACGALVALQWPERERALHASISEDADSFYAKQFAALAEAVVTEGLKDVLNGVGPGVNRSHIRMRNLGRAALFTLPFDAATRIGLSGFVGLMVRPPDGHRRYDEYLPAAFLACTGDFVKGLVGTFILQGMTTERRPARGCAWPGQRALSRLPSRIFMLTLRNSLYELIAQVTGRLHAAVALSQLSYSAVTLAREPLHDWIERGAVPVPADFDSAGTARTGDAKDEVRIHVTSAMRV